jgi:tetratricopeptide (TPR) repeat protein
MTRCQAVALLILWCFCPRSALAAASVEDAGVLAGYRLFNNGDLASAQQTFERLIAGAPSSLPAQFGLLQVIEQRSEGERVLEPEFERRIEAFLATAEERFARSDKDDEALFYLANGYMLRATYRLDHDKGIWGAARDGARAKRFSEQYVQRHPEHGDAYFALGTYNYYVEIAPTFIKIIRLFLFLPPGNRAAGLQQLERAHAQGSVFAPQAGLMLMEIYGSFESRPADAVRIGERLAAQYHDSPKVQFSLAELYEGPAVEDHERAAATYQRIIDNEDRRAGAERPAKYQARLGLAGARFSRWRTNESFAVLDAVIDRKPATPVWVMPNFLLRRSFYRGLLNDPASSADAKAVLAEPRWKEWHKGATDRLQWLERRRQSGEAAVFAALIPGNRLAVDRRWDEARGAYEQVRQKYPNHCQVRFRLAHLAFRRGEAEQALREFTAVAEDSASPDWLKAQALLFVARVHDLAGRRADAVKVYERIVDRYENEGAAWAAKVGLVTPYRRPMSET